MAGGEESTPARGAGGPFALTALVVAVALAAAGCGSHGLERDTRGGLAGRLTPICSSSLAHIDSAAAGRIGAIARLVRARARAEASKAASRRALGLRQAELATDRRALTQIKAPLERFLKAHPGHSLPPAEFAAYRALDRPYRVVAARYNRSVGAANAAVGRYNRALLAANTATTAVNRLIAAEDTAATRYEADVLRCLQPIADWRVAVLRVEKRLGPAALRAGTTAPSISCDTPYDWDVNSERQPGYEEAGYVVYGDSIIHLSPRTCFALARLVSHPAKLGCVVADAAHHPICPPGLEEEAISVVTLAHEEQHIDGVNDEAVAQCDALQKASRVARQLGLPAHVAARIAAFTNASITQPPRYRSASCRRGGALDLRLATGWPDGL